jgi:hypothetical protein
MVEMLDLNSSNPPHICSLLFLLLLSTHSAKPSRFPLSSLADYFLSSLHFFSPFFFSPPIAFSPTHLPPSFDATHSSLLLKLTFNLEFKPPSISTHFKQMPSLSFTLSFYLPLTFYE